MTRIIFGDRVGSQGRIRVGCIAILFDEKREKVLLTRRGDTGQWCLPSGGLEPGESVSEACERETLEETGLTVRVKKLVSIFSSPDRLVIYADGGRFQIIGLAFEVEPIGGEIILTDETIDIGYYSFSEMESMDIFQHHRQMIADALAGQDAPFIR
jgi:8-oxo-dGTP pyrophosphatase MutT (NUDIX family)